jgi:hypothetical protein
MGGGGGGWIEMDVLTRGNRAIRRNRGSARPLAQTRWKNTGVLGLGFNPNRHIEEKETRKTKRPIDTMLVQHKEELSGG